jgi:amino acid transporter
LFIPINLLLMAKAHSWQGLDHLVGVPLYIGAFALQLIVSLFGFDAAFDRELRPWRPPHWPLGAIAAVGLVTGVVSLIAIFMPDGLPEKPTAPRWGPTQRHGLS